MASDTQVTLERRANSIDANVERFASVTAFAKLLGNAKDVRLYIGLPSPKGGGYEADDGKLENVVVRREFKFFDKPHSLSGQKLQTLQTRLARPDTFAPYGGPKFCGGFHPDYLVEWRDEKTRYQAFFCFGCYEVRWFESDDYEVWCDMTEVGGRTLDEAFRSLVDAGARKQ